jgi:NitT/TauT family transport system permease protein
MTDLAHSMGASRLALFWKIRFPYALPNIFGGLKVGITLAVIGAIVGEFVGADSGLGYVLVIANGRLDTSLLFAAILVLVLIGIVTFLIVDIAERMAIPWHVSKRKEAVTFGTA